jgi:hypothetical protein
MDNPQPTSPQSSPPAQPVASPPPPQLPPKQNNTLWIILSLLLVATFLTGLAYIFVPQLTGKKNLNIQSLLNDKTEETISSSPTPADIKSTWKTYSNTKYEYNFYYPEGWEMAKIDADQKNLELHYVASPDLAIITIEYLTPEEYEKLPPSYCETADDKERCHRYQISSQSEALVDSDYLKKTTKDEAFISHPTNGGTLRIRITDTNGESKDAFTTIVNTLNYPNEK